MESVVRIIYSDDYLNKRSMKSSVLLVNVDFESVRNIWSQLLSLTSLCGKTLCGNN